MNLSDIRTFVQNQSGNDQFYSATEIDASINHTQLVFNDEVRYNIQPESQNSIAGTQEYTLSNLIGVSEIMYDGSLITIDSLRNILIRMSGFTTANNTGIPKYAYIRNHNILGFLPIPESIKTFIVYQGTAPATLTLDADIPEIPTQYHKTLAYLPLAEYYQKDREFNIAGYWRDLYEKDRDMARNNLLNSQARFVKQTREFES